MSVLRTLIVASLMALTLPGCYIPRGGWTLRSGIDLRTRGKPGAFVEMVDTRWDECNRLTQCQGGSSPCPPGTYPTSATYPAPVEGGSAYNPPQLTQPQPLPPEAGLRPTDPHLTDPPIPNPQGSAGLPPPVPPAPEEVDNAAVRMSQRVVVRPQPAPRKMKPRGGWLF